MRFLHTADWHLGRLFHGTHLTDDQAHVLDQFVDLARDLRPDAIVIAGDVYDRAVPPPEAVALLDDVLTRLVFDLKIPTIAIAGNHDSGERLQFGAPLLRGAGLHLVGCLRGCPTAIVLRDEHGPVHFYGLPYAEPFQVRAVLNDDSIRDHQSAMEALLSGIRATHPAGERSVLIGHAFVSGAAESESERPLSVGGAGTVPHTTFDGFHYTALGHLHAPQHFSEGRVRYSGSLLKYSFDEAYQQKGVLVVDMDANGVCTVERVELRPRRDVRRAAGLFEELLRGPAAGASIDDYLMVQLADTGLILDAAARLREVYPNLLHLERTGYRDETQDYRAPRDLKKLSDAELFTGFFAQMTGLDATPEQQACFVSAVDAVRGAEREVGAL